MILELITILNRIDMETIITIFTVLSMYMNVITNAESKYFYNADINDGVVETIYVFNQNGAGLQEKLACHYDYDEQGRLTEKTVCRWEPYTRQYVPDYKLRLTYNDDCYELARCEWSTRNENWKPFDEKVIYQSINGKLQSVNFLRLDKDGDYHSVDHLRVLDPYEGLLLADALK